MKKTVSSLKKRAWSIFSKYIRLRDCIDTTGTKEYGNCCTCGKRFEFKRLQAGHFIPGRGNSILFDERGVHAQCFACNMCREGNRVKYFRYMQRRYGEDVIRQLELADTLPKKFTIEELEGIIEGYKDSIKRLEEK